MPSGLVNASFSLPEWQALRMIFFAPCMRKKMFRNYNLTASLEIPKSSWDSFGLFMLLRRASSRHSFHVCAYSEFWRNLSFFGTQYVAYFGI